jgi:hypothetical protein
MTDKPKEFVHWTGEPVIIVGSTGTVMLPLLSAETGGLPFLTVGPKGSKNAIRFYCPLPSREQAESMPCPDGMDPTTVTFEIRHVVIGGVIPLETTAKFDAVYSKNHSGKIGKRPLHFWEPDAETITYPQTEVSLPQLHPGDRVEIEGHSWYLLTNTYGRLPSNAPENKVRYSIELWLHANLRWVPKHTRETQVQHVEGSPLQALGRGVPGQSSSWRELRALYRKSAKRDDGPRQPEVSDVPDVPEIEDPDYEDGSE